MSVNYPTTYQGIQGWAKENGTSPSEARERFVQYVILRAITNSRMLGSILVFKGGNALDFIWQPNRSTKDLDFSSLDSGLREEQLRAALQQGLDAMWRVFDVALRVQRLNRQPPGEGKTFVTYDVTIGYALPDDTNNRKRLEQGQPSKSVIPLDISLNEPICDYQPVDIQAAQPLRVSTLEDIVAEKLRSLLQQLLRDRQRRQDLLDIAVLLRRHVKLDRARVAEYLKRKAEARNVPVSRAAFNNPEIARRARVDYGALQQKTRRTFIPFDEALAELLAFVQQLDIPET